MTHPISPEFYRTQADYRRLVAARVIEARREFALTQQQLADELGLVVDSICGIECAQRDKWKVVGRVASWLGVDDLEEAELHAVAARAVKRGSSVAESQPHKLTRAGSIPAPAPKTEMGRSGERPRNRGARDAAFVRSDA